MLEPECEECRAGLLATVIDRRGISPVGDRDVDVVENEPALPGQVFSDSTLEPGTIPWGQFNGTFFLALENLPPCLNGELLRGNRFAEKEAL